MSKLPPITGAERDLLSRLCRGEHVERGPVLSSLIAKGLADDGITGPRPTTAGRAYR